MTTRDPESPVILTQGAWVHRGPILVWEPRGELPRAEVHELRPVALIACHVCRARITDPCRNRYGQVTHAHKGRLRRACSCGEPRDLPNSPDCATCRINVDESVVERLLDGERIDSRPAEKTEALRRWLETGGSERAFCRMHGWKHGRYTPKRAEGRYVERSEVA